MINRLISYHFSINNHLNQIVKIKSLFLVSCFCFKWFLLDPDPAQLLNNLDPFIFWILFFKNSVLIFWQCNWHRGGVRLLTQSHSQNYAFVFDNIWAKSWKHIFPILPFKLFPNSRHSGERSWNFSFGVFQLYDKQTFIWEFQAIWNSL